MVLQWSLDLRGRGCTAATFETSFANVNLQWGLDLAVEDAALSRSISSRVLRSLQWGLDLAVEDARVPPGDAVSRGPDPSMGPRPHGRGCQRRPARVLLPEPRASMGPRPCGRGCHKLAC